MTSIHLRSLFYAGMMGIGPAWWCTARFVYCGGSRWTILSLYAAVSVLYRSKLVDTLVVPADVEPI